MRQYAACMHNAIIGLKGFQENLLTLILQLPVPQTDTGSWVEYTKALERFAVKELGKIVL